MTPPRWAERLLEILLPDGLEGRSIIGDLAEDFEARAAKAGVRAARRWYVRAALGVAGSLLLRDLRRSFASRGGRAPFPDIVRSALRSVTRAPGFTVTTVAILALGIGASASVFSLVDGVLIRPLPYPDADALHTIQYITEGDGIPVVSEPEFHDISSDVPAIESAAAYRWSAAVLGTADEPMRMALLRTTASLSHVLGIEPAAGRWFTEDDDQPGAPDVVLLSYGTARRTFGRAEDAPGAEVLIDDRPHTVVGVLPRDLDFASTDVQAWLPLRLDLAEPWARNNHYLLTVVRLDADASRETAASQLEALAARSREAHPSMYPGELSFVPIPLKERVVGSAQAPLLLLLGAAAGLLLVAATNAAGLFLARGEGRRSEVAVRLALGASRTAICAQLLAEALVVSLLAAAVGLGLTYLTVEFIGGWAGPWLPRLNDVSMDARAILFGVGTALATGLLFGLLPAVQAGRSTLRGGGRGGLGSRRDARFRRSLVVGQLALAAVLVLGTTLMVRSLASLRSTDLGMDLTSTVIVPVQPTRTALPIDEPAVRFYADLERRIEELPGVEAVGSARRIPLRDGLDQLSILVEGRPASDIGADPAAGFQWATGGYFESARIPVLEGRTFTRTDDETAPLVAVVNEALARELWPGRSAIGERVRVRPDGWPWMEVIGVVADVRRNGPQADAPSMLYVPHAQAFLSGYLSPNDMSLVVRVGENDAATVTAAVRALVREAAPSTPPGTISTGDELTAQAVATDRFLARLLSAFALASLLLGSVGVYAVISQAVRARTQETGLRVALGASSGVIARSVLLDGVRLGALGGGIGLLGGVLVSRLFGGALLHVSPLDPLAYLIVVPTLVAVVVAATLLPAMSAARMDPVQALRNRI